MAEDKPKLEKEIVPADRQISDTAIHLRDEVLYYSRRLNEAQQVYQKFVNENGLVGQDLRIIKEVIKDNGEKK